MFANLFACKNSAASIQVKWEKNMQTCKKLFFVQDNLYVRRTVTHIFVLYWFGLDEMR